MQSWLTAKRSDLLAKLRTQTNAISCCGEKPILSVRCQYRFSGFILFQSDDLDGLSSMNPCRSSATNRQSNHPSLRDQERDPFSIVTGAECFLHPIDDQPSKPG